MKRTNLRNQKIIDFQLVVLIVMMTSVLTGQIAFAVLCFFEIGGFIYANLFWKCGGDKKSGTQPEDESNKHTTLPD